MRTLFLAVGAFALLASSPLRADEPLDLKVLYAGNPGSDREKDFTGFLAKHFAKVGKTDFQKFKEDEAKGYDVVIFDWTSIYPREKDGSLAKGSSGLNSPSAPKLSRDFDRPTILIGAAGGFVTMPMNLKINWL